MAIIKRRPKGRKKHGFLLFDLPSDHEVEGTLSTECDVVKSIVWNRGLGNRVKTIRATTPASFVAYPTYKFKVQYVHLACHGGSDGIGMIGGKVAWAKVAKQIKRHLQPLEKGKQRVFCISCCHSGDGFEKTVSEFSGYFSGAYHFKEDMIGFDIAMATWAMFYSKKTLGRPHKKIADKINYFFDKKVILFRGYN
jgi:hypothetical protein